MAAARKTDPPFLGASASWVDDQEVTFEHVKRQVADHLRKRLQARLALLGQIDLSTQDVAMELRRQMAACAVDGNLMLASDLGDATWDLLQYRQSDDLV
ncbi:hypothetical protein CMI37_16590 [Candidatus Pacearchaeota archaeon]|nr:hypothetical protein [Candidatus Pacearchaeota archaeon]